MHTKEYVTRSPSLIYSGPQDCLISFATQRHSLGTRTTVLGVFLHLKSLDGDVDVAIR